MKARFKNFIIKNKLLRNHKKLLLAVSGGPDSLAMFDLFYKFRKDLDLELGVVHLNHMFREEADSEAVFIENYVKKRGVEFFYKKVNLPQLIETKKISAEAAARKVRFRFFKEVLKKEKYSLLALAHHRDDQAETVLLNLFRGSGLQGLSGIQTFIEFNGLKIIHPMLEFSKNEILKYCQTEQLNPCFDLSNQQNIYSRNIIRNKIFPLVENKINKNAREVIARSSNLIAAENKYLQNLAQKKFNEVLIKQSSEKIIINYQAFKKTDQVLQRRIYRCIYQQLNNSLDDLYFDHILEIEKLIKNDKTGRGIDIASGIRVLISYSNLVFLKKEIDNQFLQKKLNLEEDKVITIDSRRKLEINIIERDDFSFSDSIEQAAFDYEKLNLPLYLRPRESGDKMVPLGMRGHKKIKDILIDQKVALYKRENIPLLVDAKDNILWLVPYKISNEYRITKKTDKILILRLKYN